MTATLSSPNRDSDALPISPGALPAWETADLPEPLPFSFGNALKTIGPGAILLAASIGGGEWIVGPLTAIKHGAGILWIASLAIVLQTLFNMEAVRYTMVTGEPIFTGFMRLKPGSRFWSACYILLGIAQLSVPALALGCAGVLFATATGRMPEAGDFWPNHAIAYGVIIVGVVLLQSGKKVEAVLEWLSWWMVFFIFAFLLVVNFAFVPWSIWRQTLGGFLFQNPTIPQDMDLILLASFAATAGSGGLGNLAVSNWFRDKGFGMGQRMGSIAGLLESHETPLRPIGFQPVDNDLNRGRWRHWWKYALCDQSILWGPGCVLGMVLNVNLAMAIISPSEAGQLEGAASGVFQAHYLAQKIWSGMWYLTLLNGFWILFSTHLGNTDVLVRTIVDISWTSSSRIRQFSAGRIYTVVLILLTAWGLVAVNFGNVLELFKVLAIVANPVMALGAIQILRVNLKLLPKSMQPPLWRQLALVAAAIFYGVVTTLVASSWFESYLPRDSADLIIGGLLVTLISCGAFAAGQLTGLQLPKWQSSIVALLVMAALAWFAFLGTESIVWSWFWPFSNLVLVMNLIPYGCAILAGLAWSTTPGSALRRSISVLALLCVGGYVVTKPLLGSPPECKNLWQGDVCLQTSPVTCTAACAATLLKAHQIDVEESDMAAACLTRKGTTWQGLYRGLILKTKGIPWLVDVTSPAWDKIEASEERPVVLDVGISLGADAPKIYAEDYGWQPGQLHSVVFYGYRPNDRVAIAEPTPGIGREEWTLDDLKTLYRGRCYRLMERGAALKK